MIGGEKSPEEEDEDDGEVEDGEDPEAWSLIFILKNIIDINLYK